MLAAVLVFIVAPLAAGAHLQSGVTTSTSGVLGAGEARGWGQSVASLNGRFVLAFQPDGDLVLYEGQAKLRAFGSVGAPLVPPPDVGLADVKHIVYDRGGQQVFLVNDDGTLFDHYPVSGKANVPYPGRYEVYSKSVKAWGLTGGITMKHMVRFTHGPNGIAIGFHSIPVYGDGTPMQTVEQLGQFLSGGCVRQRNDKAEQLYEWAPIGTPVVVLA